MVLGASLVGQWAGNMVECLLPRPQERKTQIHYLRAQTETVVRLADTFQPVSLTVPRAA